VPALRDYQQEMVHGVRASIQAGHRRILVISPTGSGKGTVIANRARAIAAQRRRCWVIAHREEIVGDLSERIHAEGVPHGMIAAGYHEQPRQLVQVCSVDTLVRRLDRLKPPDVIIQDEAHHMVVGNKWGRVVDSCPLAFVVGFTATGERFDGKGLGAGHGGYFTDMVLGPSTAWLTDHGFLCPALAIVPPAVDLSPIPPGRLDTRAGLDAQGEILRQGEHLGDVVGHYMRAIAPRHMGTALSYACSVPHAETQARAFREAGIAAIAIHSNTDKAMRRQAFRDLAAGSLKILVNCEIATEGTDVPSVTGVIVDRRTKSLALHLQMLGRGLRTAPGKDLAIFVDHVANIGDGQGRTNMGMPTDPRNWSLEGRATREAADPPAEPHRNCPACFARTPAAASSCSNCGYEFPVRPPAQLDTDRVEGELVEFDPVKAAAVAAIEQARRQRIREERDCRSLEDFQALGRARGYKPGWARHRWSIREQHRQTTRSADPWEGQALA
jgi:DNA repair protein RadD